jgi:uncharacterized protein
MTVRKYCDILEGTFMIRILQPWYAKSENGSRDDPNCISGTPDCFTPCCLIESPEQLYASPKPGASWEGFAMDCVCRTLGKENTEFYFWHTHGGAELDLFWQWGGQNWGVEFKYEDAPRLTRSMQTAITDLQLAGLWVVYPGKLSYAQAKNIQVLPLWRWVQHGIINGCRHLPFQSVMGASSKTAWHRRDDNTGAAKPRP